MRPDTMRDKAIDLFKQRMHCSQVLVMVGLEKLGIDEPAVIKALGAFGGGIGGTGHICGALVGAAAVVGVLHSRSSPEGKENPQMWIATKAVVQHFKELTAPFGGIDCGHIARVDWMDREQVKDFYGNPNSRRQHCVTMIGETARALGMLLEQEAERMAAKQAEQQGK